MKPPKLKVKPGKVHDDLHVKLAKSSRKLWGQPIASFRSAAYTNHIFISKDSVFELTVSLREGVGEVFYNIVLLHYGAHHDKLTAGIAKTGSTENKLRKGLNTLFAEFDT